MGAKIRPASPPYFEGLGSLFRSPVSPFHVGYYYLHCAEEKGQTAQGTYGVELGSKPQVCAPAKPTTKSCFANASDSQGRAQPRCPACTGVCVVGGGVLKGSLETSSEASLEHPCLALQLPSQADVIPSIHRNVLPHTHPRCQPASPLQLSTDLHENRRGSTDGPFSSQQPDREEVHPERYTAPRRGERG